MTLGKFDPKTINFVIRDIDTGEVKEEFRTYQATLSYFTGMQFGLQNFYEIYDCRIHEVIKRVERYGDHTNMEKKEVKTK